MYHLDTDDRDGLIAAALAEPPESRQALARQYSDLGMLFLGEAVAAAQGESLDALAEERGWCRFAPVPGPVVATELCEWRGRLVVGEVHDENAAALGGVAGHAGAFGTLAMVLEAARSWVSGSHLSPALLETVRRPWSVDVDGTRRVWASGSRARAASAVTSPAVTASAPPGSSAIASGSSPIAATR